MGICVKKVMGTEKMSAGECFCGHDCGRCVTYVATMNDDVRLRERAREFYRDTFGRDIPLSEFRCMGGRSEEVFGPCRECPFGKCCRERGIYSCAECDAPCAMYADYREKYVNKCNQV